jgi:DNA-binding response OmpR family regulator
LQHKEVTAGIRLALAPAVGDRLLVVDADSALRDTYAEHFSRSGFDVHCAATVAQAASLLERLPFDAMIADLRHGDGGTPSGIAGCLEGPRPPRVVVLTAYGEPEWAAEAARLGVDAFLHKPVSLVWLEQLLRTQLEDGRSREDPGTVAATG